MSPRDTGSDVTFFTITSREYFPGCVGMLNSLRLAGHTEPVTVLERGTSSRQRAVLEDHCRLVSLDHEVRNPCHLTAYPSQLDPDGVIVLIDSDLVVLERLDEALERAREGRICLFRDPDAERFFPEWREIFGLGARLRRQPYYNTGFVAFSVDVWPDLLNRWWEALRRIWDRPSFMEGAAMRDDPTSQPDQDALNALLMSEFPADAVYELPAIRNVFPQALSDTDLVDRDAMTCRRDGTRVWLVQCSGSPKPWTTRSVTERRNTHCYLPLLRRALTGDDVSVRVPARLLPPWLWRGPSGRAAFALLRGWLTAGGIRGLARRLASGPDDLSAPGAT